MAVAILVVFYPQSANAVDDACLFHVGVSQCSSANRNGREIGKF